MENENENKRPYNEHIEIESCVKLCKLCSYAMGINKVSCQFRTSDAGYCEEISQANNYIKKVLKRIEKHTV